MKRVGFISLATLVALALTGCLGGKLPQAAPKYAVSGQIITSGTAEGLADVKLTFSNHALVSTSGTDGKWSQTGLSGTVTVTPSKSGWTFEPKSRQVSGNSTTVNFTATPDQPPVTHTLKLSAEGQGKVTANPELETYAPGTKVKLTAAADTGWVFSHWQGDLTGSANPMEVEMLADMAVTAVFSKLEYELKITVEGQGYVTHEVAAVEALASGIEHGTTLLLTAHPATGWTFARWEGDLTGTDNPEALVMGSPKAVTAVFVESQYSLMVGVDGEGSVNTVPDAGQYKHGTSVALTAIPATGWTFSHWKGDLAGSANPWEVEILADMEITAVFSKLEYELEITVEGQGSVTHEAVIQALANGIEHGTTLLLTAHPATGWTFARWEGDLTGTDNPETLVMDSPKAITAVFVESQYSLMVGVDGQGSVETSPEAGQYKHGTSVELTAIPSTGWTFSHWQGDDLQSTDNPLVVTMTRNVNLTAVFDPPGTLTITSIPNGASVSINGEDHGTTPTSVVLLPGEYDIVLSMFQFRDYVEAFTMGSGSTSIEATLSTEGYWPLAVGNWWEYDVEIREGDNSMNARVTIEITGTLQAGTVEAFVQQMTVESNGADVETSLIGRKGDAYYYIGFWDLDTDTWVITDHDDPALVVPVDSATCGNSDWICTADIEVVVVPAGTFLSTKRVRVSRDPSSDALETEWFVPYVGLVRMSEFRPGDDEEDDSELIFELVDYFIAP